MQKIQNWTVDARLVEMAHTLGRVISVEGSSPDGTPVMLIVATADNIAELKDILKDHLPSMQKR